jgi:hypothetical protein
MFDHLRSLFRNQPEGGDDLSRWNMLGRDYIARLNGLIADNHEDRETAATAPEEPRSLELAQSVIAAVEAEDRAGRWQPDQPIADRAHEPFIDMLDRVGQNLNCVCILGPDEFLVRPGTAYRPSPALHLRGGEVIERPDILAAAMTRSHDLLVLVQEQGFSVSGGVDQAPVRLFPWPTGMTAHPLDSVQISEDGATIAFVDSEEAVWLGQAEGKDAHWARVYPSAAFLAERQADEDDDETAADDEQDEEFTWSDSMMHAALSPDGRFIAYGSQCYGHFIDRIDGIGSVRRWATIGHRSEYPHHACFSDDSAHAALNSCHFYHGATLGVRLADIEDAETPSYDEDARTTVIDGRLRVYAATWLPTKTGREGFALAGAGYLDIVSPSGDVRSTVGFGSSASSIDYCPKTGLLAVASYSGFLHIYDPSRAAEEGKVIGYRPIHERYRWVLWRDSEPFRW